MTHVFIAPHPDEVTPSCGGLIDSLRELGQDGASLAAEFGDICDQEERTTRSVALCESQMERLWDGDKAMSGAVRAYTRRVSDSAGRPAAARSAPGLQRGREPRHRAPCKRCCHDS